MILKKRTKGYCYKCNKLIDVKTLIDKKPICGKCWIDWINKNECGFMECVI